MSSQSMITCTSHADCNGEGECVQADDGSFYCDCAIGFIEPHCKNRDPCLLSGNTACQNGSTCKRINNFEFECKCRVPYEGEFCETYNLCDVDVDECIEDINAEYFDDPICHPCVAGATCRQVSKRQYICSCKAGFNHSSCYAYHNNPNPMGPAFLADSEDIQSKWNPIIPTIAISSCCLYFLLLLIIVIIVRKRKKRRPKLIVCCDVKQFENLAYYLISVETGRQWNAGVKCNVYCFLCGENGQAGPYPLSDLNLSEVRALQRCQEDNYLVSNKIDLGRVDKIVIWYDNRPPGSSWFCDKITVRNIKTDENWNFYVSTWFPQTKNKRRHEFLAATPEYVRKQSYLTTIACKQLWYQVAKHHSFISPFIYATPDRITIMFAEWMSYMLILIALYGFLVYSDSDIRNTRDYVFRSIVPENGSLAAISCFFIAFTCALLLTVLVKMKRIPTLLIWRNKPGMPKHDEDTKKRWRPPVPPLVRTVEHKGTNTDFDDGKNLEHIHKSDSSVLFRIPSTDVVKTEKWVHESITNSQDEPKQLLDEVLVHGYASSHSDINIPQIVLDYGLIGGLTDGRQQEPKRFVYTTSNNGSGLRTAIENEIRDIYAEMRIKKEGHSQLLSQKPNASEDSPPISELFIKKLQHENTTISTTSNMAAGDYSRDRFSATEEKQKLYCELCEMDIDGCWNSVVKICTFTGWILCLSLILAATVICYLYGGRYGYQRTYDWLLSFTLCWLENFMAYQFLKILLIVLTFAILIKRKKLPEVEAAKIRERFQVYYVNGLTVLPDKNALKFVQYLPKNWIPAPHVKLHCSNSNTNSMTSIKTHGT